MSSAMLSSLSGESTSLDVAKAKQRIAALKKKYALVLKARGMKDKLKQEHEKMVKSRDSIKAMEKGPAKKSAAEKWRAMRTTYMAARGKLKDFRVKNKVGGTSDDVIKGLTERAQRWFDRIAKAKK